MYKIDRILKLLYRDMDFEKLVNRMDDSGSYGGKKNSFSYFDAYNFSNEGFSNFIIKKYCDLYPENHSEDEIEHILEHLVDSLNKNKSYYDVKNKCINALDIFRLISDYFLGNSTNQLIVSFDKLLEWDAMINVVDMNIIIASLRARKNIELNDLSAVVMHDNKRIYNKMKLGYAETHMHFQASGYSTDINWYEFVKIPISKTKLEFQNKKIDFFKYKLNGQDADSERQLLAHMKLKFIRMYLYDMIRSSNHFAIVNKKLTSRSTRSLTIKNLKDALAHQNPLVFKQFENEESMILSYYDEDLQSLNLTSFGYIRFERNFLTALFKLYYQGDMNAVEVYAFNIYLVGLCIFKFTFIQDNEGMGFAKFKRFEDNKKIFITNDTNKILIESVFDKYYREENVKFIEIRIGPKTKKSMIRFISDLNKINESVYNKLKLEFPRLDKIEYGIIIHYIKSKNKIQFDAHNSRKGSFMEKLYSNSKDLTQFFEMYDESDSLYDKFNKISGVDTFTSFINSKENVHVEAVPVDYKSKLIGIDSANYEKNCRPEHFGPVFRKHRSNSSSKYKLGITFHVGEAFITLANGLRAIDEAIIYLNLQRGDRLGHAIALGLNAEQYYKIKKNKILTTLQDHLDDLAWMYSTIKSSEGQEKSLLYYLHEEIERHLQILYNNISLKPTMNQYVQSMVLRGDCPEVYRNIVELDVIENLYNDYINKYQYRINNMYSEHKASFLDFDVRRCYYQYHFNDVLKKNGSKTLIVEVDFEYLDAVIKCQNILKKKIVSKGMAIEINPSSNKKISFASKFNEIQLLNLNDRLLSRNACRASNDVNIPVTINTDDSAVFQTNLINEYSLVVSSLIKDGYNPETVYDYLDYLRSMSLELTFID